MNVGDILDLTVVGVFDRGKPNFERIALRAQDMVIIGQFGVMLGIRQQGNSAFPLRDNLYWFGDGFLNKGDWIYLYTGPGEARTVNLPNTSETLYSVHWGRPNTILDHPEIVPILFRVDAVHIIEEMLALPSATEQKA